MSFADDLKAQLDAERDTVEVSFLLNKNPYVLRFTQMDSWEWAKEADRHPPRRDVTLDRTFNYNMRELVRAVAPVCGELLQDGEPVPVEDWDALFTALSPSAVNRMCDAVWALHESEMINAVVSASKKAPSTAARPSKRR